MKALDKKLKQYVEVKDRECLKRKCYVPSYMQYVFSIGEGYKGPCVWLCRHREHHGCPEAQKEPSHF
jgi:fatty-acid desaturase